jgi:hypothetical protein
VEWSEVSEVTVLVISFAFLLLIKKLIKNNNNIKTLFKLPVAFCPNYLLTYLLSVGPRPPPPPPHRAFQELSFV